LVFVFWFLINIDLAAALPPDHSPQGDPIGGYPLNHACGAAVDGEGDLYVANAGESRIEVFDPEGNHLASVTNSNEPCGLAVDSRGDLFISEKGTGNVVRRVPDEEPPFTASPSYGPSELIDASGNAKGLAIDGDNSGLFAGDALYLAKGGHVDVYADERQRISIEAIGGTYELSFDGQSTLPLSFTASNAEVQQALESLSTIGEGNVIVTTGNFAETDHLISFTGALGETDVSQVGVDTGGLSGTVSREERQGGLIGTIGTGTLGNATGVAAYSYPTSYTGPKLGRKFDSYVFVTDASSDEVDIFSGEDKITALPLRNAIAGPTDAEAFGFGSADGAYLAADPGDAGLDGKCAASLEQACTAGHFLVYDPVHEAVDEFEADGEFVDQLSDPAFEDAEPTGLAIDRAGGLSDGTIYVTAGASLGARVVSFGPLTQPSRPLLPTPLSHEKLETAGPVAVDSAGDVYVLVGSFIRVFSPTGGEIKVGPEGKGIPVPEPTRDIAVDTEGHVYTMYRLGGNQPEGETVQFYTPTSYPPHAGTEYSGPVVVADGNDFSPPTVFSEGLAIDVTNNHVFFAGDDGVLELDSAASGSSILNSCVDCSFNLAPTDVAVDAATGNLYVSEQSHRVSIYNESETQRLARITGIRSRQGLFTSSPGSIAVNEANGHVLTFDPGRGAVEEYDSSGAFVAEFGEFQTLVRPFGIAIDNSVGATSGTTYVGFDDTVEPYDLTAFGPLTYGERPLATTGIADEIGPTSSTLHGTVEPRGFEVEECVFEYLEEAEYQGNLEAREAEGHGKPAAEGFGFEGAEEASCEEPEAAEIDKGSAAVPVHAVVNGVEPQSERYRFRLIAKNKYGQSDGDAGLFGPPSLTPEEPRPILYTEATLRATIESSGLPTKYRFEYGLVGDGYDHATPQGELSPGNGSVTVHVPLTGLEEGAQYHFRVTAENEAKVITVEGRPAETFRMLARAQSQACTNTEYRTGFSGNLPDCRAYELVTPAETRGAGPFAVGGGNAGEEFNNWLVAPRGETAGESVAYFIAGTLPGFEGTGTLDGYRARRAPGPHPGQGWSNSLFGPSFAETGGNKPSQHGVSADQEYSFWTFLATNYLGTPAGFEVVGRGSFGDDPKAVGRFLGRGGTHVIFSSRQHLESKAAPVATESIYDRATGSSEANVISVKPDGGSFTTKEDAVYAGANEDGSAVVFRVGEALYLHREGQTVTIAEGPATFAGISEDGTRVFFIDKDLVGKEVPVADLYVCDVDAGSCVGGSEPPGRKEIAPSSIFVDVAAEGSRAYFTSTSVLDEAEEGTAGKDNLYIWDGSGVRFVAILDPQDLGSFGTTSINLSRWTSGVAAGVDIGRGHDPTRSTPDGKILVFESHARLTAYDNQGACGPKGEMAPCVEIYRYDTTANEIVCLSCDPSDARPNADASLQTLGRPTEASTLIPNITDDGKKAFFQSRDRLLPEDANEAQDVYEWRAQNVDGCGGAGGCLALISSGQGEADSFLYGMTPSGRDVFFRTDEALVGADISGSPSLYDAREGGGIPEARTEEVCHGDACQGAGMVPPELPSPASIGSGGGNIKGACPRGGHRVKGRCVHRRKHRARHHRHHGHGTTHKRRGGR
jgi:hypothetical protein